MTRERWQKVREMFQAALDRAPEERSAFLLNACVEDESLRREVESLLAAHEKDGSFIDSPAYEAAAGMFATDSDLTLGQEIGHYEILSTLGKGGMGEVYLARDTKLSRKVALKVLPGAFTQDRERLRRFDQEARATSALNHPNILTIFEIGEADGRHYIATEFIEGETLRQHIAVGSLKLGETLDIAEQITSALSAAHGAGIVHRHIKPENIMLRRDGIVKTLDFGLAKLAQAGPRGSEESTRALVKTGAGVVMGTVAYMSPEQARGLPVDARTDIWSLGVVMYELIAGRIPFEGETSTDVIVAITQKEPPPIARFAPHVPPELDWIVTKALRKDRDERYQTIKELLTDLRRLQQ